jgi:hypothetical protein
VPFYEETIPIEDFLFRYDNGAVSGQLFAALSLQMLFVELSLLLLVLDGMPYGV